MHFERISKINGWVSKEEKLQQLQISLEGVAADGVRDIDDTAPTAYEDILLL